MATTKFAPRMWRCFLQGRHVGHPGRVCSTHVEMFLWSGLRRLEPPCLLHACGDVSPAAYGNNLSGAFAPRMWRCFLHHSPWTRPREVCSTHVEMFPCPSPEACSRCSLLHACGDVSATGRRSLKITKFAPRMWRCFSFHVGKAFAVVVCSTHVEMFPPLVSDGVFSCCLLHACGDVSSS